MAERDAAGTIEAVAGGVVDVRFPARARLPAPREALEVVGRPDCPLEVHGQLAHGVVRALALGETIGLGRGQEVEATGRALEVPVGRGVLGRVIDCLGRPLDGGPPLASDMTRAPLHRRPPPLGRHRGQPTPIETGIKVIDLLCPFARGGKTGLFGGAGVGKTIILMEFIAQAVQAGRGLAVFAGIGERIREGHELWRDLQTAGLLGQTALVFGQMDEPAGVRLRVPHAALTICEHLRDEERADVLLLVDNIFRFVQAGAETSTMLGRLPSRVGYQPTLATDLAEVEERIASTVEGTITSVQAVYVPADDIDDPGAAAVLEHLDARVILSRTMAATGLYPAVDPLRSGSRLLDPALVGARHYQVAEAVRQALARYRELEDVIALLGLSELSPEDQLLVRRARRLQRFLTQPFVTSQAFTGRPGVRVPLADTLQGCERILEGELDRTDEQALFMIGALPPAGRA